MLHRKLGLSIAGLTLLMVALAGPTYRAAAAETVDVDKMISTAKTASDHQAIADYYKQQAAAARAKVEEHKKMAEAYSMSKPGPNTKTHFHEHCEALIRSYQAEAKEYDAMAKAHEDMAAQAGK